MLKFLLYFIVGSSFVAEFGEARRLIGPAGRFLTLVPEAASGLLLVGVLLTWGHKRELIMSPKYVIVAVLMIAHMVLGAIANSVAPGTFVGGIRIFYTYIPLFMLPAVYDFSDREIKRFMNFLLVLSLAQVPVAFYQRIFVFPETPTGDVVKGMFSSGALMSIYLIFALTTLVALHLKGRITRFWLFALGGALLLPIMINETKGSLVLLPIALISVGYFYSRSSRRLLTMMKMAGASAVFILTFAVAYDYYYPQEGQRFAVLKFFAEDAAGNLYKDQDQPKEGRIGRIDSVLYAYNELSKDPVKLAMGLGIGNVANPGTLSFVVGKYADFYVLYGASTTTYASLLWSTGLIGILITLGMLFILFRDARRVSDEDSLRGALALAWCGILPMLPVAFLYKDLIYSAPIVIVCMFASGLVAAGCQRARASRANKGYPLISSAPATIGDIRARPGSTR